MTNASSTYLGIVVGAIIGGIISWWIYNRQKKTSETQDLLLMRIKELDERHDRILKRMEQWDVHHDSTLNAIFELDKKIEHIIEKQDMPRDLIKGGGKLSSMSTKEMKDQNDSK